MNRKHLLVVAPHPDDEILGVGGTMAKYIKAGGGVTVLTIAGHRPPLYSEEVYQQTVREAKAAHELIGVERSIFLDLPATTLGVMKTHELNGLIARAVFGDRVCLCPPLIITEEQVREMIRRFTAALDDTLEWVRA